MDTERRNGRFSYEPDGGLLVVGLREAVLEPASPPGTVVSRYLDLVADQRAAMPTERVHLRDEELESLARMLTLPPDELAALIETELAKLLDAADVEGAPVEAHARRRWLLLLAAAIGLGAAAGTAVMASASSSEPGSGEPGPTVEVVQLSDGSTATRTESAPVPPTEDTDIGSAVSYERNE